MLGCRRHSGLGLDFDVDVDRLPQQFMRCDYPFPKNEANMRALVGTRLGHRAQRHADHGVVAVLWRCLFWHRAQRYVICDGMATFGFQGIVTQLIEAGIASSDAELTTLFSGENFDVHSYVETALREVPRPGPRQASGALSTPTLAAPTRRPADAERAGVGPGNAAPLARAGSAANSGAGAAPAADNLDADGGAPGSAINEL